MISPIRNSAAMLVLILGFHLQLAHGEIVINIYEDGDNVQVDGSGTINTTALIFQYESPVFARISAPDGEVNFQDDVTNARDVYSFTGTSLPAFGPFPGGDPYKYPDVGTGTGFGIAGNFIFTPVDYVSGDLLSAQMTFNNQTLDSLQLNVGTYEASWGSGATADKVTVNVLSGVPEPSGLTLFGLASTFVVIRRRKR